jgi:sugar/nucleoside kinase (ribokinase family)
VIRHHLFGAAHIDRIGRLENRTAFGQSNPGTMRDSVGGAAFNVASSLTALGAHVSLSSAIGNDESGAHIHRVAADRQIDFHPLAHPGLHPTATYTGLLDAQGELIIALADMEIYAAADVHKTTVAAGAWLLVDANLSPEMIGALLQKPTAHRAGMTVSASKAKRLRPHIDRLDLLFTNRAEAAALVNAPPADPLKMLGQMIADIGCPRAVISDGAGLLVVVDEGAVTERAVDSVAVKDVTGAGDALAAGTLFALGEGVRFPDAISTGIAAAHAILAHPGPYRADLSNAIGAVL